MCYLCANFKKHRRGKILTLIVNTISKLYSKTVLYNQLVKNSDNYDGESLSWNSSWNARYSQCAQAVQQLIKQNTVYRDVRDIGNRFHLLRVCDDNLRYPQRTAEVCPAHSITATRHFNYHPSYQTTPTIVFLIMIRTLVSITRHFCTILVN